MAVPNCPEYCCSNNRGGWRSACLTTPSPSGRVRPGRRRGGPSSPRLLLCSRGCHEGRQALSVCQVPAHHTNLLHQKQRLQFSTANRPAHVNPRGIQTWLLPFPWSIRPLQRRDAASAPRPRLSCAAPPLLSTGGHECHPRIRGAHLPPLVCPQ